MDNQTRAMAFHHENGYEAQLDLAKSFAGEGGRIATMEDVVHARLHTGMRDYPWRNTFITDSRIYTGRSAGGSDLLIFTHGNRPDTREAHEVFGLPKQYTDASLPAIDADTFSKLESGHFGEVAIVDLAGYVNASKGNKASNRYRYEEALKDPIIMAALGREAEAYLLYQYQLQMKWLENNPQEDRDNVVAVTNRLYNIYDNGHTKGGPYSLSVRPGRVFPLTMESVAFYGKGSSNERRTAHGCEIGSAQNSGRDDLIFTPYYVVGIRGVEPITTIQPSILNLVGKIKENWPIFVQEVTEVPTDPFLGIKPDGSKERPYYLLTKWGSEPLFTGRITEAGAETTVPEFRIIEIENLAYQEIKFQSPYSTPGITSKQYPYEGLWEAGLANMPEGANALTFHGSSMGGGKYSSHVSYHRIRVSEEPFYILMKCGDRLFTQYADEYKVTGQPHRLVEVKKQLKTRKVHVPQEALSSTDHLHRWPYYQFVAQQAPEAANAMFIEGPRFGLEVKVTYYEVTLTNKAFRKLSDIRADFDWQLEKRAEAGLLTT